MGNQLSFLWNLMAVKRDVRCVMVGLDAAGKTSILKQLKFGECKHTIPTIGFNVETVEYKNLKLTCWDVGSGMKIRPLWRYYYQNCDCLIFVVDSFDLDRLKEAAEELHHALSDDQLKNATLLVYANKQDLPNAATPSKIQELFQLSSLRQRKWVIQGCVAPTGAGLWEGLEFLSSNLPEKK